MYTGLFRVRLRRLEMMVLLQTSTTWLALICLLKITHPSAAAGLTPKL